MSKSQLDKMFLKYFKNQYGRKQLRNVRKVARKASKGGVIQEGDKLFLLSNCDVKGEK